MDAYPQAKSQCLHGMPSFYVGMPILIVRMGKFIVCTGCLFSQRDAHIYCENGHPHAYIHVDIGIGMPIFT